MFLPMALQCAGMGTLLNIENVPCTEKRKRVNRFELGL